MDRYLCISVTFLDPLFHGKGDRDASEWPPSPMRLFEAMLAGSRAGKRNARWSAGDDLRQSFEWLERQTPPDIIAPRARSAPAYTLFVPNNDSDELFDRQDRLTSKIPRPRRMTGADPEGSERQTLYYVWSVPEDDWPAASGYTGILSSECRHLMALGWGIDQVVGNGSVLTSEEVAQLPGERWQPWLADTSRMDRLRVPAQGSLQDLDTVYEAFCNQLDSGAYVRPPRVSRFDQVRYVKTTNLPRRPYAAFELPQGCSFRPEASNIVAAMLRSLACIEQNRNDFQDRFGDDTEVYLAGHVNGGERTPPRFSYLPLPTIGHRHADGMIRRLLIAEPYGGDGARASWAERRLGGQALTDKDGNGRGQLLELWRNSSRRMVNRYVREHRIWSTVTPAVLPGFDDGKLTKAEKLFIRAIRQAGLSTDGITDLTLRKAPFWPGSQHPRNYLRPRYLKNLPAWHVRLEFREPVPGPITIGPGRHVGLGTMAGLDPRHPAE